MMRRLDRQAGLSRDGDGVDVDGRDWINQSRQMSGVLLWMKLSRLGFPPGPHDDGPALSRVRASGGAGWHSEKIPYSEP